MQTTERATRRPFHETIIAAIEQTSNIGELRLLGALIKATKIPKGHDEIVESWKCRLKQCHFETAGERDIYGVVADLLAQKQEAAAQEKTKGGNQNAEVQKV